MHDSKYGDSKYGGANRPAYNKTHSNIYGKGVKDEATLGISGPVTLRESGKESVQLSIEMEKYLRNADFFESEESAQLRERVLGRLDYLVKQFVASMSGNSSTTGTANGKIFTFGSYRLGVHDKGADIDTLCVVPRHINRRDFFTVFYEQLRNDPNVSELSKVEEAYVPLIKMKYSGISIDLVFARVNVPVVRESLDLLGDGLLRAMDEKCIVSLNGSRVTDALLGLVPNKAVFHGALRAVKFWARRRYVYGAAYGYYGGVAYAISVARICQLYPRYCAFDVVCKFFEEFGQWKWPAPVQLREIIDLGYGLRVWDPRTNPADKYHRMPVITPAYPSMCSTHNVTASTNTVIIEEFNRANEILKKGLSKSRGVARTGGMGGMSAGGEVSEKSMGVVAHSGMGAVSHSEASACTGELVHTPFMAVPLESKCSHIEKVGDSPITITKINCVDENADFLIFQSVFDELFKISNFFKKYKLFIEVLAEAPPGSDALAWNGFLESKIRVLATKLENVEGVLLAVPFPKAFKYNNNSEEYNNEYSINNNTDSASNNMDSASTLNSTDSAATNNITNNTGIAINNIDPNTGDSHIYKRKADDNYENTKKTRIASNNTEYNNTISDNTVHNTAFPSINEPLLTKTSFFIALDVQINKNSSKKLFIDAPIKDFLSFINSWELKTPNMNIQIKSRKKKEVQAFLREYYSE